MPVFLANTEKGSSCSALAFTVPEARSSTGLDCSSCLKGLQLPPSPVRLLPAMQAADAPGSTSPRHWLADPFLLLLLCLLLSAIMSPILSDLNQRMSL